MDAGDTITGMLAVTAEVIGVMLSPAAYVAMTDELEQYPLEDVKAALRRVKRECRRLTLPDILDRLPNQPPGVEAAWAMAVEARVWDEDATLVMPRAILGAFPFALWNEGDKIGARMAFKERYPEALEKYRGEMAVSLGYDSTTRDEAIQAAERQGLLPESANHVRGLLGDGSQAENLALPPGNVDHDPDGHRIASVSEGVRSILARLDPENADLLHLPPEVQEREQVRRRLRKRYHGGPDGTHPGESSETTSRDPGHDTAPSAHDEPGASEADRGYHEGVREV